MIRRSRIRTRPRPLRWGLRSRGEAAPQAEEALRISEMQLGLFVEQAPVHLALFDLDMVYIAASRRWIDEYGRGHKVLRGLCHYAVNPDVPERWKEIHRRGMAGEFQQCEEDLWIQKDGSKHWLRWAVHPWFDKSGKVSGIIIFGEDITQRKRSEELLQQQQQQLALIIDNIPSTLALLDGSYRYLFVNRQYERRYGITAAQAVGRPLEEVIGREATERARPHFAHAEKGESVTFEVGYQDPSSAVRYGQLTLAPQCAEDGSMKSLLVVGNDVTALKQAEQALHDANEALEHRVQERTKELEAANRELEAFSYSVSHDLRAPLRVIDGFSRIALESYSSALPAEAQSLLSDIRTNTQQMGRLVDDLLSFARFSRQPIRRQTIETEPLVRSVLDALLAMQPALRVQTHIGQLPPCQADLGLLRQVWQNLIDNALKYAAKRDPMILEIGCQVSAGEEVYFVRDNGVGFDMRQVKKLFGVFQRLHRAEDYQGTGVGLALVKRIVERHGGRVWAEAEPDRGATFFFTLPCREVASA